MDVPVMIRRTEQGAFRASTAFPEALFAEAATRDEALQGLSEQIRGQLTGIELVTLDLPSAQRTNPWLAAAGSLKNHPDADAVEGHIRNYRRQIDEDAQHP